MVACLAGACSRDPTPATEASAGTARPRVVFLGDSLTAGLGVSPAEAYPGVLERRMHDAGLDYEVVNAGVSGDTSAGALRRVDWSLEGDVRVLVVAIGANDGLRGLPADALRQNLDAIVAAAERRHVAVLLAGMEAPPNFGEAYTREFRTVYRDVARSRRVRFLPFLLDGVAGRPALNQADGIHPNAEGHRLVADLVWRELEPMLTARPPS
jgi:acyl-CoA thioesterase-1